MTCGLAHASYSLLEWQAVKLTFFAPWVLGMVMYANEFETKEKEKLTATYVIYVLYLRPVRKINLFWY